MCLLVFGGLDFSALFQPLVAPKKCFFGWVFAFLSFLEFVPRITPVQIQLESWNLLCILSKISRYAFWDFQLFKVKIHLCPNLGKGCCGINSAKITLFSPNRQKIRICITYPKLNFLSHLGGEIWGSPPFLTSKSAVPSLSPLQIGLGSWN